MKSISFAFVLATLGFATAAQAMTLGSPSALVVTVVDRAPDVWPSIDQSQSVDLPKGGAWQAGASVWQLPSDMFPIDLGDSSSPPLDPCRNACSPFYGGIFGQPLTSNGANGWETTSFWVIFAPSDSGATNQALLEFSGIQKSLSLLWGSVDNTNRLEFFLDGSSVASFAGSDFAGIGEAGVVLNPGQGAVLATFAGIDFDAVLFSAKAGGGSFEFSNITTAVPLPAGMVLLLTGFGAFAVVGRKRKAAV